MATDGAAPRRGLLVDFGGVLTTDVFASFQRVLRGGGPRARAPCATGSAATRRPQTLLFDLEEGKLTEEEFEPRSPRCSRSPTRPA